MEITCTLFPQEAVKTLASRTRKGPCPIFPSPSANHPFHSWPHCFPEAKAPQRIQTPHQKAPVDGEAEEEKKEKKNQPTKTKQRRATFANHIFPNS